MPTWSPDGQRIAFATLASPRLSSGSTLHARPANGGGQDELLLAPENSTIPITLTWPEWSADGRYLVYQKSSGPAGGSVWARPTTGEKKPFLVVQSQSQQGTIVYSGLSPDGKWLAYSSTESGREEVYVTPFPSGNGRWQLSQNGGTSPAWRGDGKEIYYSGFYGTQTEVFAVPIHVQGDQFVTESPRKLFAVHHLPASGIPFVVSPDGNRFLMAAVPEAESVPMTLVVNWTAELNK